MANGLIPVVTIDYRRLLYHCFPIRMNLLGILLERPEFVQVDFNELQPDEFR